MLRLRLPLLLALALCALAVSAAPALGAAPAASVAAPANDDEWGDEEPGDDWEDAGDAGDDEWCVALDEDGEPLPDEGCGDDEDLCLADDEYDDSWEDSPGDEAAAAAASDDDEEWGYESDDEWSDEDPCGEAGEDAAPARISKLRATPARRGGVRVRFRLDRSARVTLALERVGGRCAKPARSAQRHGARGGARTGRACTRPQALRGTVSVAGSAGANATTLRAWKGHPLKPGGYRLTATPATGDGRDAAATFTLHAPPHGR